MKSTLAVGIDLGTTFCSIAVFKNGKPEVIANGLDGERLTPSAVFYDPESSEIAVGKYAEDGGIQQNSNLIYDIKRLMGRKFDDVYVQEIIRKREYKYKIVRGKDDNVEIEVKHRKKVVRKLPEDIASEILKYLKGYASEYLGEKISEAVISVPANFGDAQRKATRKAANLAGLNVLRLVSEPVAAAIHYSLDKLITKSNWLVFDFGGGTLDVSIIDGDDGEFNVRCTEGDSFLGGRDFDKNLNDSICRSAMETIGGTEELFYAHLLRIKNKCTQLKRMLSVKNEATFVLDHFGSQEANRLYIIISREQFDNLNENLFSRAMDLVVQCLESADLSADDIDRVVLVGGTTRIPKIRRMLEAHFGEQKLKTDVNPDEAIALGGAIQAAILKKGDRGLEKYKINEVAPFSIGIRLSGGLMKVGIKKNTPLPATSILRTATVENLQKTSYKEIYEGERKNCKYNTLLGSLTLSDLPLGQAGQVVIETVLNLNEDGILTVQTEAISKALKKTETVIEIKEHHLSLRSRKSTLEDIIRIKQEDYVFETLVRYMWRSTDFFHRILYELDEISDDEEQEKVKQICENFIMYAERIEDIASLDELKEKFKLAKQEVEPFIKDIISVDIVV